VPHGRLKGRLDTLIRNSPSDEFICPARFCPIIIQKFNVLRKSCRLKSDPFVRIGYLTDPTNHKFISFKIKNAKSLRVAVFGGRQTSQSGSAAISGLMSASEYGKLIERYHVHWTSPIPTLKGKYQLNSQSPPRAYAYHIHSS
jgi:hypothetical protein